MPLHGFTPLARAAAARFAKFHASRDNADKLCAGGEHVTAPFAASRPVMAADLARVHGWHASHHGGSGTLSTVRLARFHASRDTGAWLLENERTNCALDHVTAVRRNTLFNRLKRKFLNGLFAKNVNGSCV